MIYLYIFCGSDLLCLLVPSISGAAAFATDPRSNTEPGINIMIAGIIFQLSEITTSAPLFAVVILGKTSVPQKRLVAATVFPLNLIYMKSVHRMIELLQGWRDFLLLRERFFMALCGSMMALAVAVFDVANPSFGLFDGEEKTTRGSKSQPDKRIDISRVDMATK